MKVFIGILGSVMVLSLLTACTGNQEKIEALENKVQELESEKEQEDTDKVEKNNSTDQMSETTGKEEESTNNESSTDAEEEAADPSEEQEAGWSVKADNYEENMNWEDYNPEEASGIDEYDLGETLYLDSNINITLTRVVYADSGGYTIEFFIKNPTQEFFTMDNQYFEVSSSYGTYIEKSGMFGSHPSQVKIPPENNGYFYIDTENRMDSELEDNSLEIYYQLTDDYIYWNVSNKEIEGYKNETEEFLSEYEDQKEKGQEADTDLDSSN